MPAPSVDTTAISASIAMERMAMNVPAAELNNCAIAYWQAGYHSEATHLFHSALANLRDECRREDGLALQSDLQPSEELKEAQAESTEDSAEAEAIPCCLVSSCHAIPIEMPHDDCFVLCYNQAILLDATATYQDDALLASALMFNMALLHHAKGLEWSHTTVLEQARRLYHLSLDLLGGQSRSRNNTLLYLALLNNVANIDSYLRRKEHMMVSLNKMCDILNSQVCLLDCDMMTEDDDEDYLTFSLNVMVGQTITFMIAPAA